jgi:hypothetical protein
MTVNITKPAINLRSELADLRKPSGVAGEAMLRAETPQEQFNLIGAGRRNLLINGDQRIDQRNGGSAITLNGWTAYVADRMRFGARPSTGTATVQQVADAPEGFYYSAKISRLTGSADANNYYNLLTKIEGNDIAHSGVGTSSAQDITISFWVKSNLTGTWSVGLQNEAGGGDRRSYNTEYTINSASVWEYKTVTIPLLQSGVFYYDNRACFQVNFDLGSGSGYTNTILNQWQSANIVASANAVRFFETAGATWQITGIQLELGKVATPFEHRSYGEELALCQRYFEKIKYDTSTDSGGGAAAETLIANGFAYTTTRSLNYLKFNVIKRTQPTVTIVGGVAKIEVLHTTNGWVTTTAFTARANIHGTRLDLTHPSSLTAGNALEVRILSGGYLNIDAEI